MAIPTSPSSNGSGQDPAGGDAAAGRASLGAVRLSTERLSSSYCNVSTVNGTREEVVISFGVNQDWDRLSPNMSVSLLKRIILSPHGAKRFNERLSQVLAEYERRYGELKP